MTLNVSKGCKKPTQQQQQHNVYPALKRFPEIKFWHGFKQEIMTNSVKGLLEV